MSITSLFPLIALALFLGSSESYVSTPSTTTRRQAHCSVSSLPPSLVQQIPFHLSSKKRISVNDESSFSRLNSIQYMTSSSSSEEEDEEEKETKEEKEATEESSSSAVAKAEDSEEKKTSFWSKLGFKKKEDDGQTFRQRLAKMGLAVLLSYGWVSNMSYSVTLSLAWYGFCKKTGQSPLAPGQWKGFLAVYAGFYVFNNIIRPIRLAASVAVSTYFDRIVNYIQRKTNLSKSLSIGIVVFLANIVGTISAMCLGVTLASKLAGVPVFPPKVPVA